MIFVRQKTEAEVDAGDSAPRHLGAEDVLAALDAVTAGFGPGGEVRAGQQRMAVAVAEALDTATPLVVQAGTGVGKSLAYALPIALSGHTVVIATASKALQDQLADKDLPALAAALGGGLRWAVLKGRTNYLCQQAADESAAAARRSGTTPTLGFDEGASGDDGDSVAQETERLIDWGRHSPTGDRAELDFEPSAAAWSAVSVGQGECPGAKKCPRGDTCFAEAAYERARQAKVIVINIHLFGAHVASGGFLLPPHAAVVIDECHDAEDIISASLGVTLSPGRVRGVANALRTLSGSRRSAAGLFRHADALARVLAPHAGKRMAKGAAGDAGLGEALEQLAEAVRQEQGRLRELAAGGDLAARKERVAKALTGLGGDVEAVLKAGAGQVTWVEAGVVQPTLRVAPIDVGGNLARVAWSSATAILTSATVPPGVAGRLGLGRRARELSVESPFDYRRQALLYVPRLPDPRSGEFEAASHDELEFLIGAAGGRTLALFTSWRAMGAARKALDARVPFRLLAQNDLPKPALIEAFRSDETSCLFATMGFWQGVDVPGQACSLVTLDRLPFARPDDPLAQARRERAGPSAFYTVDIPYAATRLAQGVGRLIRTGADRGVVAVLDPRLAEAPYRDRILASMPPMRRVRRRSDVSEFFALLGPGAMEQPEAFCRIPFVK